MGAERSFTADRRHRVWRVLAAFSLLASIVPLVGLTAAAADPLPGDTWVTDGPVDAMVIANGKVYIGGDFSQVGPNTGGGAEVDSSSGIYDAAVDRVDGAVFAVVEDGSGGWYIAGDFSFVDGLSRPRLAHIGSNGAVTSWRPNVSSGRVNALYRSGPTLYLGGEFTTVAGVARNNLAAVTISSENASLLSWNPDANGAVHAVAGDGSGGLYVAGDFSTVGGSARNRLARVDLASGAVGAWNPSANGTVRSLAVNGTTVLVGGDFSSAGGSARASLAALDAATGTASSWNPGTDGTVRTVVTDGASVYVGGAFATAGGAARANLAAIDAVSGAAMSWNPAADAPVNSLVLDGGAVVVGGEFATLGGVVRKRAARLDVAGSVEGFDPDVNGPVHAVAVAGSRTYLGGTFNSVNGVDRAHLAALDVTTGVVDPTWAPAADGPVLALETSSNGSVVFIGGAFMSINGGDHRRIAAVDATTGTVDGTFFAQANNRVHALHVAAGVLYMGGDFGTVSSISRKRVAALDEVTGAIDPTWDPVLDDSVRAIATSPNGSLVYLGGLFDTVDGLPRDEIAAIDAASGVVDPTWNPNTNRRVYEFEVTANEVLVAMGGGGGRVYSFNPVSGVTNWFLHVDGDVQTLAARGNHIYAGGHFLNAGAEPRQFFLAADLATGALEPTWVPQGTGGLGPFAMVEDGGRIWTGGEFVEIEGRSAGRVTYLDAILFAPPGSYRDRILSDGAAVYYRFGETSGTVAGDAAGTLNATYSGGFTLGAAGLIADADAAVTLDGASGSVEIPDSDLINTGGPHEQRTIEIWFAADGTTARQVLYEEGGATRGANLYVEGGRLYYGAWNTSNNGDGTTPWAAPVFVSTPINGGQTYHAVLSFDYADALVAYLDGVQVGSDAAVGRLFAHGNDIAAGEVAGSTRFATGTSSQSNAFAGIIDELAIYNNALTSAQVGSHFLLGTLTGAAPGAGIVTPAPGATVGGTVTVQAAAEDAADAVGSLSVEISTDGGGSWSAAPYQPSSGAYELAWDTTASADGPKTLLARATDSEANQTTSPGVVVTVDNVNAAPIVAVAAPADGATVDGVVSVEVDATDQEDPLGSLDVDVRFNGGPWQSATWQPGLGRYAYSWDTSSFPPGAVTIEARAIDSLLAQTVGSAVSVTVAAPGAYPARIAADGAATYWRLGEASGVTAVDAQSGVDGTYSGGPGLGAPSVIEGDPDTAVAFDGSNDVVDLPDDPVTNTGGPYEAKSIELWFNAADVAARGVLYEQGGTSRGMSVYVEGGMLMAGAWNVTNNGDGTTPWAAPVFLGVPVAAGTDHHIVLTFDYAANSVALYVDGLPADSAAGVGRLFAHGSDAAIGAMRNSSRFASGGVGGAGFHFAGVIDEVATYNSVLTPSDVAAHFQIGSGGGGAPLAAIAAPGEGATVSGITTVAVSASDDGDPVGTLDVEVSVDGGSNWASTAYNSVSDRYEWSWDTTGAANGPATIEARATDSGAQTTSANPVAVTVANGSGYSAAVLADSPAVYWRLDESTGSTAMDQQGGVDGTYANGAVLGLAGLVTDGSAVGFDGNDDHVAVPDTALINVGDPIEERTIELWFNAVNVASRQVLFEEGGNSRGINIYVDGGNLYFGAWNRTAHGDGTTPWAGGEIFLSTPVAANTTYHVVLTLDQPNDLLAAYLNGTPVASSGGIGRLYAHGSDIGVGAKIIQARFHTGGSGGSGSYFEGRLDEIAIYHSVLSPARVAAHHAAGQ